MDFGDSSDEFSAGVMSGKYALSREHAAKIAQQKQAEAAVQSQIANATRPRKDPTFDNTGKV